MTTSTTEAELLALSQATKEALYISRLLTELQVRLDATKITVQCDNVQTIRLVTAEIANLKTQLRHVDIHNHWLRQEVKQGRIEVTYTESAKLMADGLTKALQSSRFKEFTSQLGLEDITTLLKCRETVEMTREEVEEIIQAEVDQFY